MGFFNKTKETPAELENIYGGVILYNQTTKIITVRNGFSKKEILIGDIADFGIAYGLKHFYSADIIANKEKDGGLEKYFSGHYDIAKIPSISICLKLTNGKYVFYPITIGSTKKGRTLIIAEQIFDRLNAIIRN